MHNTKYLCVGIRMVRRPQRQQDYRKLRYNRYCQTLENHYRYDGADDSVRLFKPAVRPDFELCGMHGHVTYVYGLFVDCTHSWRRDPNLQELLRPFVHKSAIRRSV